MKTFNFVIFCSLVVSSTADTMKWLWLNEKIKDIKDWNTQKCSDHHLPLSERQRNYCSKFVAYMEFVSYSAEKLKTECQKTFVDFKWNCDTILQYPHTDKSLSSATREYAAVNALISAHLLHSIISRCQKKGLCQKCKVKKEKIKEGSRRWNEGLMTIYHESDVCDEMFPQPIHFVKRFLKVGRTKMEDFSVRKRAEEQIHYHNRKVGIEIAKDTRSPRCFCRTLYRPCPAKLCYTAVDTFWKAEEKIRKLYRNARKVRINSDGTITPIDNPSRKVGNMELIYAEYYEICSSAKGNKDRMCSVDEKMRRELKYPLCSSLCCGKGNYVKIPAIQGWDCNCKFLNGCCKLTCDKCTKSVFRYRCTA